MTAEKSERPLCLATSSLDAKYTINFGGEDIVSVLSPAAETHAQLYAAETGYRKKYITLYDSRTGRARLDGANIVTAKLSFLYSDAPREEGYIGDLDIKSVSLRVPITEPQYTFNVVDFFDDRTFYTTCTQNKAKRNTTFNERLQQRINLFGGYDFFVKSTSALTSTRGFGLVVQKPMFHETFHHSEQAVMEFLSNREGSDFIRDSLDKLGAATVGGIILDMYSTRYLCENCNVNLIGFQSTHERGAIYDITRKLHDSDVYTPEEGLLWSTRVSAGASGRGTALSPARETVDADVEHSIDKHHRYLVLQGDTAKLGLQKTAEDNGYSLDTFSGDFFTSREIAKKNMEKYLGSRVCFE